MYTKPANARVQKNPEVIKSVRDFCQSFQFNPASSGLSSRVKAGKITTGNCHPLLAATPSNPVLNHRQMLNSILSEANSMEIKNMTGELEVGSGAG